MNNAIKPIENNCFYRKLSKSMKKIQEMSVLVKMKLERNFK